MDKIKLGYLTIYRGDISDMKNNKTEIAFKRYQFLDNRWYLNPTDSSLDRINRMLQQHEPSILISEVSTKSIYIQFKFKDNTCTVNN